MDRWRQLRMKTYSRARRLFGRWGDRYLDYGSLAAGERWSVIAATLSALIRFRLMRPARLRLLSHSPAWVVAGSLQKRPHGWYRVHGAAAAGHVRVRFNIWPIEVGDHVRLVKGRLTAVGYATPNFTEIIFLLPSGELEPDPRSSEMSRAWAAYNAARR